jgi:hypothetical protein
MRWDKKKRVMEIIYTDNDSDNLIMSSTKRDSVSFKRDPSMRWFSTSLSLTAGLHVRRPLFPALVHREQNKKLAKWLVSGFIYHLDFSGKNLTCCVNEGWKIPDNAEY